MPTNGQNPRPDRVAGRQTRASSIASTLREEIISGALNPNAKLNLEQLRDRFEISLSPLREAISRLVAEGLVELEDQRGFRVAPVSVANLNEITLLRAELETLALSQSIANGDLDWEAAVTGAVYRLDRASKGADKDDPHLAWWDALSDFHTNLLGSPNLPQLYKYTRILRHQMDRYTKVLVVFDPKTCSLKAAEYKAIAEAAIARDEPLATALLSAQIRRSGKDLKAALDAYLTETPPNSESQVV